MQERTKPPIDDRTRDSASAEDNDSSLRGQDAAEADNARRKQQDGMSKGRHFSDRDATWGRKER